MIENSFVPENVMEQALKGCNLSATGNARRNKATGRIVLKL